jgi:hypothetical protein
MAPLNSGSGGSFALFGSLALDRRRNLRDTYGTVLLFSDVF